MYRLPSITSYRQWSPEFPKSRLSLWILLLLLPLTDIMAQSPHGEDFQMNCAACHTSDSWEIPLTLWDFEPVSPTKKRKMSSEEASADSIRFNHNDTGFPLDGGHLATDCRLCHEALVFAETPMECISCHTDLHHNTVGSDCARCHSTDNWLVDDVTALHQDNGFPLLGIHAQISCNDCHISESDLQFPRIGNDCLNCHLADYLASTEPNHAALGYSTDCITCHDINAFDWSSESILHDFFPLTGGHAGVDCIACHADGYEGTPTDCAACHQEDFEQTTDPNHQQLGFSMDCVICHTTDPDWMPAGFGDHDALYFPIYSGNHKDEWDSCTECHTVAGNFSSFSCIDCHEHNDPNDLAGEHDDVNGYQYESSACLECHPNGD